MSDSPSKRKRQASLGASSSSNIPSKIDTSLSLEFSESTSSPRTKVAYAFQGLHLSSPVGKIDFTTPKFHAEAPLTPSDEIRKRIRVLETPHTRSGVEIFETPQPAQGFKIGFGGERAVDPFIQEKAEGVLLQNEVDPIIISASKGSSRGEASGYENGKGKGKAKSTSKQHSGHRPTTSNSKPRAGSTKRVGTPPLRFDPKVLNSKSSATTTFLDIDPDQTDLTWHVDEITGHHPNDPEDDGRGINGIGFKPSAAQARQRTERRKQQMAEYKTREAREAREKRGARRRGGGGEVVCESGAMEAARRVRFLEGLQTI